MHNAIKEILISQTEIQNKIRELGKQITRDYKDKSPVLISILKGGVVFLADLMRQIELPLEIEFLGVESYGDSTHTSGV
ncbi:MAG: hypoxanthine phosphoribosyltransferase, partial [Candidatus Cloacimonetes bacterium]|nr:hypoxanthine phosphoribosyltransferase [Candidatus Cloacimonadota bacterium]